MLVLCCNGLWDPGDRTSHWFYPCWANSKHEMHLFGIITNQFNSDQPGLFLTPQQTVCSISILEDHIFWMCALHAVHWILGTATISAPQYVVFIVSTYFPMTMTQYSPSLNLQSTSDIEHKLPVLSTHCSENACYCIQWPEVSYQFGHVNWIKYFGGFRIVFIADGIPGLPMHLFSSCIENILQMSTSDKALENFLQMLSHS